MDAPLLVTADDALREEVLRLAAAAGAAPHVVADPGAALAGWSRAPVVLVGGDLAPGLAGLAPSRRDGVHVVAWGPVGTELFRTALALGAEDLSELPRSEAWLVEVLTDAGDPRRPRGHVVGVVGGSGGAGATTLACALGQVAARVGEAVVVDCDPLGPGVDRVLGLEDLDGCRWDALCQTTGRLSARALREALPRRDGLAALAWPAGSTATVQPFALREAVSAAQRGHRLVVLDLPRADPAVLAEVATRCDRLLVVVTPTVGGLAAAARCCARLAGTTGVGLVVRGGRGGLGARGVDERALSRTAGAPVVGTVPEQRGLAESIDLGLGPVRSPRSPLGRACAALLADLDQQAAA